MTMDELSNVQGRAWDDIDVRDICAQRDIVQC